MSILHKLSLLRFQAPSHKNMPHQQEASAASQTIHMMRECSYIDTGSIGRLGAESIASDIGHHVNQGT